MAGCALGLSGVAGAADLKIAVVDMGRLIKAHPDAKSADALLEKEVEDFEAEQKEMKEGYEKLKKAFEVARKEASNKALSEEAREEKIQKAESAIAEVRDYERKIQDELGTRQKQIGDLRLRMQKRIVGKILEAVKGYATKAGYTLVLDKTGNSVNGVEVVLYSEPKIDITEDLVKIVAKETSGGVVGVGEKP
jgi:outer membrane protein